MSLENQVHQSLAAIERVMRELGLWQTVPPEAEAFNSTEPFCLDSMKAEQWLQWVLIPRIRALLERDAALPTRFAITPYFEEALALDPTDAQPLLQALQQLDDLLNAENS